MNENKKTIDVTALGELLVDFTMNGQSEQGNQIFEACPGGAPCTCSSSENGQKDSIHWKSRK